MPKKYFYTDPLAAAWMAANFGMKFVKGGKPLGPVSYSFDRNDVYGNKLKYRVHYESLPILEPQADDVLAVQGHRNNGKWYYGPTNPSGEGNICVGVMIMKKASVVSMRIIQRNGVAFHWPDSDCQYG